MESEIDSKPWDQISCPYEHCDNTLGYKEVKGVLVGNDALLEKYLPSLSLLPVLSLPYPEQSSSGQTKKQIAT